MGVSVLWDRDRCHPGRQMILCRDMTDIGGWVVREVGRCQPVKTSEGGRRGRGRSRLAM